MGFLGLKLILGLTEVAVGCAMGPGGRDGQWSQVVMVTQIVLLLKHAGLWS